jgi:hypothetical protein
MDVLADTSMGLMKAFQNLLQRQKRPSASKFTYAPAGSAIHARFAIPMKQRLQVDSIISELGSRDPAAAADSDRIKQLISDLTKLPIKPVPVKRETRIDNSKSYPYASKKRGG